jgi:hypothetical protein
VTDYYRRRGAFERATEALAAAPSTVSENEDSAAQEELSTPLNAGVSPINGENTPTQRT